MRVNDFPGADKPGRILDRLVDPSAALRRPDGNRTSVLASGECPSLRGCDEHILVKDKSGRILGTGIAG